MPKTRRGDAGMTTLDYDGESAAPRPVSQTVEKYLRKSISLSDILGRLLRSWHMTFLGAVLGAVVGVYAIWTTPPSYTISLTLLPLESGSADMSGGGGSGLGAIAGMLGSNGPIPKFTRFVASLYSVGVAQAMDKKYDMVCRTYGSCDKATHVLRKSTGFYPWVARTVANIAHLPDPDAPRTAVDLARYTTGNVTITSDPNTRLLLLSMDSRDPKFAKEYLLDLTNAANDFIKDQDNAIAKKNVEYVTSQLKTNTDLSQRAALTSMLANEEQSLMFTAVDLPYVAEIQDGPIVDVSNAAVRLLAAYTMLGLLLGAALGIGASFMPEEKRFWSRRWTGS
jgi:hypothetical protein